MQHLLEQDRVVAVMRERHPPKGQILRARGDRDQPIIARHLRQHPGRRLGAHHGRRVLGEPARIQAGAAADVGDQVTIGEL